MYRLDGIICIDWMDNMYRLDGIIYRLDGIICID